MSRPTADVDSRALEGAPVELDTEATVNAALRQVVRRRALDGFDVLRDIDGAPAEVEANRRMPPVSPRCESPPV